MTPMTPHARTLRAIALASACLASAAHAMPVAGQGTWETTLQARDLDGDRSNGAEAYYDTALDITWLADAFQARTSGYQVSVNHAPGDTMVWPDAVAWAANLSLYGITDWRLPKSFVADPKECDGPFSVACGVNVDPTTSELAHMYHVTLGNISLISPSGFSPVSGGGLTNTGNFVNLVSGYYWMQTAAPPSAWMFNTQYGGQALWYTSQGSAAWAVLDGDRGTPLSAVPEPAAGLLMAAGGLLLAARRRRAQHQAVVA